MYHIDRFYIHISIHLTMIPLDPFVFEKGFRQKANHQVIEDLKRQGAIMRVQCQQISMRGWIADKC